MKEYKLRSGVKWQGALKEKDVKQTNIKQRLGAFHNIFILIQHSINFAYQNRPSHFGKYVPLKRVCSRMPSTPPRAWITSVR